MGDGIALVPGASVKNRTADTDHPYRQESDLLYLSGFTEPGALLWLRAARGELVRSGIYLRSKDLEREIWDGRRLGIEAAPETLGVDEAKGIADLIGDLGSLVEDQETLYHPYSNRPDLDTKIFALLARGRTMGRSAKVSPTTVIDLTCITHEMRLFKDADEVAAILEANRISGRGHVAAMAGAAPGMREFEVAALVERHFLETGTVPAYPTVCGSGSNATFLHHTHNDGTLGEQDLILIDAGCEYQGYAADITRTFPASGTFTPDQREVYAAVLAAQEAALAVCEPGSTIELVHEAALGSLIESLKGWGLISGSWTEQKELGELLLKKDDEGAQERIKELDLRSYRDFDMHGTCHWLGLDVHDVGHYRVDGKYRPLEPGMVFTVEPGLYFGAHLSDIPDRFRGIGVRIEDDILITPEGYQNLTPVPKTILEVEAACKGG